MMFGKKAILLAASLLAISLWGCSTDFDAENNQNTTGTTVSEASLLGAGNCVGCHQDATLSTTASPQAIADYLAGKHVIHSTSINAASDESCLGCHDPLGDGQSLEQYISSGSIPLDGLAAVTCENCHGKGGDHASGVLPVPYVTPDYQRCGQCHNADFFHSNFHSNAEADNIIEDFTDSPHLNGNQRTEAPCAKCHSDEGAKQYKNVTGGPSAIEAGASSDIGSASPIQCRTCHQAHKLDLLLAADENVTGSSEYNTCTNCHQASDGYHGENGVGLITARVIYDTHFDDATTTGIEGYNLGPDLDADDGLSVVGSDSPRVCRDCHNVHAADTTKNKQWANSAHGGNIAQVKAEVEAASGAVASLTAVVDSTTGSDYSGDITTGDAWQHNDWKNPSSFAGGSTICQRCHTATGVKNFLNDPDNYDPANNDYSHLTGEDREMLYCWGCHADNSGNLRNPGALTLDYTVDSSSVVLSDLGKSNVCAACHSGRGNMESYGLTGTPSTAMTTKPGFGPNTQNVTKTHYLAAAATIYQSLTNVGYQYAGLSYSDPVFYGHDGIGLNSDSPESGSGPCAACHMTDQNHDLAVVEKDGSGVITKLNGTICVTCHTGRFALFVADSLVGTTQDIWDGSAAVPTTVTQQMADDAATELEHEAEGFHEALEILKQQLAAKGLTFTGSYPYFSGASWIDEGTFGAAHNFNYLHHEPGAYAHNRFYAKRLIFDSIDWLDGDTVGGDGNNLDGAITINSTTYPAAYAWLGESRP